ncbi:major facilitator superfamily domain-containing protein [Ilyonectria robusta]|uniref:major facilitator superfamily domain-containing protein n=1 Tax=Ilyonectria robusta TaxID=1079257 RepID=UPI001E8CE9E5|nr:major facilitator superfamily domain-containing protein [Ilyonectria robusta]KAH8735629.1 major facilitator superfamily domain-containing protein [Ilyonectria robusta]
MRTKSVTSLSSTETHTSTDPKKRWSDGVKEKPTTDDKQDPIPGSSLPASEKLTSPIEPDVETPAPSGPAFDKEAEENYKPKTLKFWLIILSAFVSMFLVALDRTILSTAIPAITNEFNSLGDIGWYGSAYMLTTAAFQLVFGRIYKFYDLRLSFLACIILFEVGSALCGAAPNSEAFIVGRAIAGIGSAGIMTGSMMTVIPMIPLHKRPMFQSMFAMVFGISSVCGPLVGGAFTEKATWRWCFYMNLPIGAAAFLFLFLFLKSPKKPQESVPFTKHITRLDPLGTFFFLPSMVCLVLALQWGGSTYAWSNWRLILLFVIFGVTAIAFCTVQVMMPETATIPLRIIRQRTMLSGAFVMFFLAGAMMLAVYYVPLWFQATKNLDPVKSGIYTIPLVLSLVVASFVSAMFTQRIGYYVPMMLLCPCVMAIGEGLLSTFTPATGSPRWIGYQFLVGFGLGLGMQTVGLAVQTTLPKDDVSTGLAITFFCQQLGGAVFVSVGQTILSSLLVKRLAHIPGLDGNTIVNTGATDLHEVVPEKYMDAVLEAYNYAITRIFLAAVALSIAGLISAMFMEWKSIKKGKQGKQGPPAAESSDQEKESSEEKK